MTAALKVIAPGLHTSLQDDGRRGFQDVGVPVSGPLDRVALRLANALVGNPQDTAALEILVQGPTLEVMSQSVRLRSWAAPAASTYSTDRSALRRRARASGSRRARACG